jgi:hypothetical protein
MTPVKSARSECASVATCALPEELCSIAIETKTWKTKINGTQVLVAKIDRQIAPSRPTPPVAIRRWKTMHYRGKAQSIRHKDPPYQVAKYFVEPETVNLVHKKLKNSDHVHVKKQTVVKGEENPNLPQAPYRKHPARVHQQHHMSD